MVTDEVGSLKEIVAACELELKRLEAERAGLRERASFIADRGADASLDLRIIEQAAAEFEAEAEGA